MHATMLNTENAESILRDLFASIGWQKPFEEALKDECRNVCLYGLTDNLSDSKGSAYSLLCDLAEKRGCMPGDLEWDEVQEAFPQFHLHHDSDGTWYDRGRLFCVRDEEIAREAVASLGEDKFETSFEARFSRKVPAGYYL